MNQTNADYHLAVQADLDEVVLSVIAPCFNEEGNIDALVDRTLATFDVMGADGELILIDDGSVDETWQRIVARSQNDRRVRGQRQHRNFGIEAAWRKGLQAARGHLVCLIDSDLQNRPEDIARLFKAYIQHVPDLVQAVRHPVRGLRRRRLFSRGLNLLLNVAFGTKLRDNKSGFVLGRKSSITPLLEHRHAYRYFQSFIGAAAGVRGYLIAQVDTDFEQRSAGKSFLSRFPLVVSARIVWELFKFRVETWGLSRARRGQVDWFGSALSIHGGGS
jgi:glycosyltransferase involved in cell wall biosynthesis